MKQLIDKSLALAVLIEKGQKSTRYKLGDTWELNFNEIKEAIDSLPVIPEEKVGHWIFHDDIHNIYGGRCIECSQCGEKYMISYIFDEKYCRNCGSHNLERKNE